MVARDSNSALESEGGRFSQVQGWSGLMSELQSQSRKLESNNVSNNQTKPTNQKEKLKTQ